MTRLAFIMLPAALLVLGACAADAVPQEDVGTSDDALRTCSVPTSRKLHEYFEECRFGNQWVLCNRPAVDEYFTDFEPKNLAAGCNAFCQSVNSRCPDYKAMGSLTVVRAPYQEPAGPNRQKRGYASTCTCKPSPEASPVFQTQGGVYYQNDSGHFCQFPDPSYVTGLAPGQPIAQLPAIPAGLIFDGWCHPTDRAFSTGGGIYYENAGRHYCHFTTMESYQNYLNHGGAPAVALDQIPPGAVFDGACQ